MADNSIKDRILILVPSLYSYGGIAQYFKVLKPHFSFPVEYFTRGVRTQHSTISRLLYPFVQLKDYIYFFRKLRSDDYAFVHLNTSFGWTGLMRDYVFILILRATKTPYIVFFRGIDEDLIVKIEKYCINLFKNNFLKADKVIVLSQKLLSHLKKIDPQCPVFLETTVVDEAMLKHLNEKVLTKKFKSNHQNMLFLARLEKDKGVYEVIEAFKIVNRKYPTCTLSICGQGKEYGTVKAMIKNIPNVNLLGYVSGDKKKEVFSRSSIYLFPSYHEGMPNSVLEAMAFGLPVITTAVGGLVDFFIDGEMGYYVDKKNVQNLTEKIEYLLQKPSLALSMGLTNFQYAKEHFYSAVVAARLETYYTEIIHAHRKCS